MKCKKITTFLIEHASGTSLRKISGQVFEYIIATRIASALTSSSSFLQNRVLTCEGDFNCRSTSESGVSILRLRRELLIPESIYPLQLDPFVRKICPCSGRASVRRCRPGSASVVRDDHLGAPINCLLRGNQE